MVELVGKNRVTAPGEGWCHRQIGEIAGGESQRGRKAGESGDFLFQCLMRCKVAADQMRCATTRAPSLRSRGKCLGDFRVAGQAKVIIAGEIKQLFAVDRNQSPAGRFKHAPAAGQASAFDCSEFLAQASFDNGCF